MAEKLCKKCGTVKALDEFYKDRNNKDGLDARCKDCRRIFRPKASLTKEEVWAKNMWRKYRLRPEDYEAVLEKQQYLCAVCKTGIDKTNAMVDHNHSCCSSKNSWGECVRGLLCAGCNYFVGWLETREELLYEAYDYLGWNNG